MISPRSLKPSASMVTPSKFCPVALSTLPVTMATVSLVLVLTNLSEISRTARLLGGSSGVERVMIEGSKISKRAPIERGLMRAE